MIDANIGSAKDNMKSAIHNWYKFTAGFSYKFVLLLPKRKASHQLEMKAKK